ncbi:hypothetical protein BBO99_00009345 [Phytophthora kernoviae]|uniref:rRNA biogenesis protein RRP36 n=1 Tax=Phytophthora kernoviae TaxID=325452 RepID=A0A3R7JNS7_9STRA|nr:hypothetical protein BBI17_009211 [Phytophthora kernoviae]RLN73608.1 hypothetical protein BBO99_00009345 [Phytophthora kernoviae]
MATPSDARDVPLEERLRQKKNGFAVFNTKERPVVSDTRTLRRANKNQPLELSSKRAVGRFRNVVEVKKRKVLDPRFEAQSGRLNEDLFNKTYAFLDDYKQRELQELKQQLKKTKSVTEKEELKHEIALRSQEMKEKQKQQMIQGALTKRKREEREAVASGKNPFYLKRKDKKKVELQAKFQDLQETGRLSKFMAKKRKKNASKDHRWLPTQRK